MLERENCAYLASRCKELGFLLEKFASPGRVSVPDYIVTGRGRVLFLEVKATGKKPSEAQRRDHNKRLSQGANVTYADGKDEIDITLTRFGAGLPIPYKRV